MQGVVHMLSGYLQDLIPEQGEVVQYHLVLDSGRVHLNPHIGREIRFVHTGAKACTLCGRKVKKLFANGSCYPCFRDRPENDLCVVKPHLCHYETCRDQAWGDAHCMVPTYLYIARSSDVKVGISRNIPGRWMEQGAVESMPIALLATRKAAGELEVYLSQYLTDKTNWRKMLTGNTTDTTLAAVREQVLGLIPEAYREYILPADEQSTSTFHYPLTGLPEKIAALDLDRGPVAGRLLGIKARYLILSHGEEQGEGDRTTPVLNLLKYAGYHVDMEFV